jgi:hypothetical protein
MRRGMCLKKRLPVKRASGSGLRYPTVNAQNFKGTAGTLKRARYVLAFLQTGSMEIARRAAKLSPHAHWKIIRMIAENGHYADSERSGRPCLYTEAEMEAAYNALVKQKYGKLNGVELLKQLREEGLVHETAEPKRFLQHLTSHIRSKGQKLITNCTKTTFFLSEADARARLLYSKEWLERLNTMSLGNVVFADEVCLEESPHPKGVSALVERGGADGNGMSCTCLPPP